MFNVYLNKFIDHYIQILKQVGGFFLQFNNLSINSLMINYFIITYLFNYLIKSLHFIIYL